MIRKDITSVEASLRKDIEISIESVRKEIEINQNKGIKTLSGIISLATTIISLVIIFHK